MLTASCVWYPFVSTPSSFSRARMRCRALRLSSPVKPSVLSTMSQASFACVSSCIGSARFPGTANI